MGGTSTWRDLFHCLVIICLGLQPGQLAIAHGVLDQIIDYQI